MHCSICQKEITGAVRLVKGETACDECHASQRGPSTMERLLTEKPKHHVHTQSLDVRLANHKPAPSPFTAKGVGHRLFAIHGVDHRRDTGIGSGIGTEEDGSSSLAAENMATLSDMEAKLKRTKNAIERLITNIEMYISHTFGANQAMCSMAAEFLEISSPNVARFNVFHAFGKVQDSISSHFAEKIVHIKGLIDGPLQVFVKSINAFITRVHEVKQFVGVYDDSSVRFRQILETSGGVIRDGVEKQLVLVGAPMSRAASLHDSLLYDLALFDEQKTRHFDALFNAFSQLQKQSFNHASAEDLDLILIIQPNEAPVPVPESDMITLDTVLIDPMSLEVFKIFTRQERCAEVLLAWLDMERYKQVHSDIQASEARYIYDRYIALDSPLEVCFGDGIRQKVNDNLDVGQHEDVFFPCQNSCYETLSHDIFPRFMASQMGAGLQRIKAQANKTSVSVPLAGRAQSAAVRPVPIPPIKQRATMTVPTPPMEKKRGGYAGAAVDFFRRKLAGDEKRSSSAPRSRGSSGWNWAGFWAESELDDGNSDSTPVLAVPLSTVLAARSDPKLPFGVLHGLVSLFNVGLSKAMLDMQMSTLELAGGASTAEKHAFNTMSSSSSLEDCLSSTICTGLFIPFLESKNRLQYLRCAAGCARFRRVASAAEITDEIVLRLSVLNDESSDQLGKAGTILHTYLHTYLHTHLHTHPLIVYGTAHDEEWRLAFFIFETYLRDGLPGSQRVDISTTLRRHVTQSLSLISENVPRPPSDMFEQVVTSVCLPSLVTSWEEFRTSHVFSENQKVMEALWSMSVEDSLSEQDIQRSALPVRPLSMPM